MRICWSKSAREDYLYFSDNDPYRLNKINNLIHDIFKSPFSGIGNPTPIKCEYLGYWSRRIDIVNRLIYRFDNDVLYIAQCKYHQ